MTDLAHTITVLPSTRSFEVFRDETVLAAAIRQGVTLPYGCKDGACGSCKCQMTQGQVDMQPYATKALSEEEKAQGYILTCRALPQKDLVIESRQVTHEDAFALRKMPVRVSTLEVAAPDVMIVSMQLPAMETFRYHAGQYVEFILKDGSRRAYSMATAPHRQAQAPAMELHIRHLPGGKFTDHVFGDMKPKEILRIEGPFGSFFLQEASERPIIMLASGTGFAPVKAMLEHMQHKAITRPVHFYWGARRPRDLYQNDWVLTMQAQMPNLQYIPVVSDALAEDRWQGRTGFVHQAVLDDFPTLAGHEVYACGAPIVVETARRTFTSERNLPAEQFFSDAFISEADRQNAKP